MKKPTPTSGGFFGEDGNTAGAVLAGEAADTDNMTGFAVDTAVLSDDDLETAIVELKRHIDASQARLLVLVGEYHTRDLAPLRHLLSTVGWIRNALRLTSAAASTMVRTARGLRVMPQVAKAASDGEVTPEAVRLLTQARRRHPDEFDDHEPVFADIAQYLTTKELRVAIEHWEQQIDYPSAVAKVKHQRQRRRVSLSQTWEGMWHLSGELDPETGALIDTAIRSIADRENVMASRDGSDDDRYPWQRRADALGDLCSFWLTNSDEVGTSGGSKPHITVTTTLETLLGLEGGLPTIDGLAIDPAEMQRIICDSGVIRMVLDADSQPLDVGRESRTVTPAIRRALNQRDKGCTWEGCNAPPSWCDAHHIISWTKHLGPTSVENMTLLCRTHHRATHQLADKIADKLAERTTDSQPTGIPP